MKLSLDCVNTDFTQHSPSASEASKPKAMLVSVCFFTTIFGDHENERESLAGPY